MSDLEQEIEKLKKENKKLSLESKLRKSMAVELDRQKDLLRQATEEVEAQKEKIEGISLKLSRYLPVQLYEQIFSGSLDIHKKVREKNSRNSSTILLTSHLSQNRSRQRRSANF